MTERIAIKKFRCPARAKKYTACLGCDGVVIGHNTRSGDTIILRYPDGRVIKGLCIKLMGAKEPGVVEGGLSCLE